MSSPWGTSWSSRGIVSPYRLRTTPRLVRLDTIRPISKTKTSIHRSCSPVCRPKIAMLIQFDVLFWGLPSFFSVNPGSHSHVMSFWLKRTSLEEAPTSNRISRSWRGRTHPPGELWVKLLGYHMDVWRLGIPPLLAIHMHSLHSRVWLKLVSNWKVWTFSFREIDGFFPIKPVVVWFNDSQLVLYNIT